jgi:hypothetical protein
MTEADLGHEEFALSIGRNKAFGMIAMTLRRSRAFRHSAV